MRNAIASALRLGLVVLVVAGLALSGLALAQTSDEPAVETQSPAESTTPEATPDDQAQERPFRFGRRGPGNLLRVAAKTIGIEVDELWEQLQDEDASIASVAAANGSSGDAVVAAAVAELEERLAEAVADERITQDEADERLADATERITEAVASEDPPLRRGPGHRKGGHLGAASEEVAEVLGLTVDELRDALQNEATLAELAEQQGVAVDDLVAVMIAPIEERLAEAVADERITQDEADERLTDATERVTEAIESGEGPCGPGGRRGPGRRPGVGDGAGFFGAGPGGPTGPAGEGVIDA